MTENSQKSYFYKQFTKSVVLVGGLLITRYIILQRFVILHFGAPFTIFTSIIKDNFKNMQSTYSFTKNH